MASWSEKDSVGGSSTVAEAMAVCWARQVIHDGGLRDVEVESDGKVLVDGLNDNGCPEIYGELLLQDIKDIARLVNVFKFSQIARRLAYIINVVNDEFIWIKEVPTSVEPLVIDDVRPLPTHAF
ncbi:conserved hypothetical protein [Ricinus communis]|uniref:RNase H type-1 domain-containing protein n=1 Tax=Ricinus communis TaxID=3988 RepID=B9T3C3_RICCO|nr:conserved hypothetical protein [Ricinus communis]EEF29644.1 conserved hypothetical protein [Ricinus communis]